MKVYSIKASGIYGGGMAIVAARSEEEAMKLATGLDTSWYTRYDAPDKIRKLSLRCDGEPRVIDHYENGE